MIKRKGTIKKGIAWLMTAVMVFSITPVMAEPIQAQAEETPTTTKNIAGLGTSVIVDPTAPTSHTDAWKGSYVYYGNYDADGDETAEPVKYRVLDASTTDYSADGLTQTMFLDCDSILYYQKFDNDGIANEDDKKENDWSISDAKSSLNGDGFLNKAGVFTTAEKNAIATSTVDSHALTTDSATGVNVASWTQSTFVNYVALTGEQIFLLDAEDVSNGAYGYSMTDKATENRKKTGSSDAYWWLRSADISIDDFAGCVYVDGYIVNIFGKYASPGVSPALNLNLSSVLFSSVVSGTAGETGAEYKLTLKDAEKSVALTEGRSVTKASDGTITVPYTYTDKENATDKEKVNQISVMITDKAYDAEKAANAQEAQILYYGALQDIKDAEGTASTVAKVATGTGTFVLPSGLDGKMQGKDYHIYLLAEHVNMDDSATTSVDESLNTDYASEPLEIEVKTPIATVAVPNLEKSAPAAEQPFVTEITVSFKGVADTASLTWKKEDTEPTGNAEWKTIYQAYVTLKAADGYTFVDAMGNRASVTLNGNPVDAKNITLKADGTLDVYCGEYPTATRKITNVTAPEVSTQFNAYYEAGNVLTSNDELGTTAKVTLEGNTEPKTVAMAVEWSVVDENGNAISYNATPLASNTFKWTVKASEYADYNKADAVLEGTVTIQNKDYTPVTIDGADATVIYADRDTIDIKEYFIFDENAGEPTFELLDTSTAEGSLEGTTLSMKTLGSFAIKVTTAINGVFNTGKCTMNLIVEKATPNVTQLPTVADRTYHPSAALADTDITVGVVKSVSGNDLTGTWNWEETNPVPTVDKDGYAAVFTPDDTIHYKEITKTIPVNVSKATPYIKTAPTASAITYGDALSNSLLTDGKVQYSVSDNTVVSGIFTWKETAINPTVADSGKTEYALVFKPTDVQNYNTVETKLPLTVNKADTTPNKPENTEMTVPYTIKTAGEVTLPEGWVWQEADKTKALEAGKAVTATAIYNGADKGNYVTESITISITRQACTHTWDAGVVTKEATAAQKGEKTYTCSVCKTTKTEDIQVLDAPKKGTRVADDSGKATYKVTKSDLQNGTVTYVAPLDKKATDVTIPATITIDGVTFKVTAIEKNAFKKNKNIKSVTIGKNVNKIGSKAFYGCSKLKTLTIKSAKLTKKKIGSKAFAKTPKSMTVKVSKKKFKAYKSMLIGRGVNKKAKFKKL